MKKLLALVSALALTIGVAQAQVQSPGLSTPGVSSPVAGQQFVAPSMTPLLRRDLIPQQHLVSFSNSAAPIVCVLGDSTMLDGANNDIGAASGQSNFFNILKRRMTEDNPLKTITFIDLAVGGSTWASLNAGTQLTTALSDNCNTVFIGLGVNDTYDLAISQINTAITTLTTGGSIIPDIILVANKPATNNPSAGSPYNTSAWQIGAQNAAAIERTMAITNNAVSVIPYQPGIGLIDLGRYFTMIEYGYDPVNQYLQLIPSAAASGIASFPYSFPTSQNGDYYVDFTLVGAATNFANATGITIITVLLSQPPSGSASGSWVNITPKSGTSFNAIAYAGTGLTTQTTGGTIGSGDLHIQIEAHQEQVKVTVNGTVLSTLYVPRYVGQFQPTVTLAGTVGAVTLTVNNYAQGISQPTTAVWNDAALYGVSGGAGVNGGNGVNHASSIGISSAEELVLEGTDFRGSTLPPTIDNRIINGRMEIDQKQETASVADTAAGLLTIDRFYVIQNQATSRYTFQQVTDGPPGFTKAMKISVSSANATPATGSFALWSQQIEGPQITDLGFGTAGAASMCVDFWVKANNIGSYPVTLKTPSATRAILETFPVNVASTWQYENLVIPGDVTGTWSTAPGSSGGLVVSFGLGAGTTYQGTAGAWGGAGLYATAATVQLVTLTSATLEFTGLRLFPCLVDRPPIWRPYRQEFELARAFYQKSFPVGTAPAQSAAVAGATCVQNPIAAGEPSAYIPFSPRMAASPTITTFNPSASNANWRDVTASADVTVSVDPSTAKSTTGVEIAAGATVTTLADNLCIHWTADAGF